ncbi:ArsR/SmtB family transcription factor [Microlunatus parietis]|uniref:ArsR/SmtB family transcription factor n=1 Tax=Microlunatus parietis TaxID=682979 RepID=UPI0035E3FFA8
MSGGDGPAAVKALAEPLEMSLPGVMQHLQVLEDAGVIVTERSAACAAAESSRRHSARRRAGSAGSARNGNGSLINSTTT